MPSSLDYLGRSWGGSKLKKCEGCGRGQGNAQQMRTRCEQRTETFGGVRAEDKNFLPATSLCCTTGRASGLHIIGGLHSKLVYGKGLAGGLPFSAARPTLFSSPPDCLYVLPAGLPFCFLCSTPARRQFTFFIW